MVITEELARHLQRIKSIAFTFSGVAEKIVVQPAHHVPRVDVPFCGEEGVAHVCHATCGKSNHSCFFATDVCVGNSGRSLWGKGTHCMNILQIRCLEE